MGAFLHGRLPSTAGALYAELRANVLGAVQAEWERSGYLWEQYSPETGHGMRNHPFNGWSALVLLILAESY